ncbi:MAG TPA: amino acid adenylation domain-containing protein [Rhodothermales bacterium]|nr:amino acid adenylation domain-containing protein [Rhodothermales bacterium]
MSDLLHHIVDRSADRFPDAAAFRFQGRDLTYAELSRQSNAVAATLIDAGIERGDRVGIHLNRGLRVPQAVFGIMKAGAAFVPLDPQQPTGRLTDVVRSAGIRCIVTDQQTAASVLEVVDGGAGVEFLLGPDASGTAERTVSWSDVDRGDCAFNGVPGLVPEDMAYLMFTSGSTGTPKGIVHTHFSGHSFASTAAKVYGLTPDDRLSGFPPLHFDQAMFDYFSGPLAGATTVIIPEAHMMMPASLSQLMDQERLTVWYSVPYALVQLLERGALHERDMSSLRWVLFGGEVFPLGQLRRLMELWPVARFSNVYGPAEVNQCTYFHVPPPAEWPADWTALPLGDLWPHAEGLVLDEDGTILPDGSPGEFIVRTPTMMSGYWDGAKERNTVFFTRSRDGRTETFYRTGDLVLREKDGLYRFLGRMDRQIKSRGFRIELDEIETAIARFPDVAEAAAYAVNDDWGTRLIHAAIRPGGATPPSIAQLRAFLAGELPRYAVPVSIRILDDFPRTSSGKTDRLALEKEHQKQQTALETD